MVLLIRCSLGGSPCRFRPHLPPNSQVNIHLSLSITIPPVKMQGNTPYPSNRAKHKTMKAHRKSRAGCYTCKGRRIKVRQPSHLIPTLIHHQCCESRPVCGHCLRGNMNCVWPEAQPVAVSVRPGGVLYQSRGFGLKDMRFFHDFMTASYPHLPLDCDRAWTNDIPLLAQEVCYAIGLQCRRRS